MTLVCSIGINHQPTYLTLERHHVIPVAWQLHYAPPAGTPDLHPGVDPDGRGRLWDARTVQLCPTHHRNVHFFIVALMAAHARGGGAKVSLRHGGSKRELAIAQLALERFTAAGGSLDQLVAQHQWGAA